MMTALSSNDVMLYSPAGTSLRVRAADWGKVISAARAQGWKEAGTLPPPVRFDETNGRVIRQDGWTGSYEIALGQTVTRPDAFAMTAALAGMAVFDRFVAFARDGFVITRASDSPSATDACEFVIANEEPDSQVKHSVDHFTFRR